RGGAPEKTAGRAAGPSPPLRSSRSLLAGALGGAGHALGGVLAVDPRPFELLVPRRHQHAALVAALPAEDLAGLAALLAALLQVRRPRGVGLDLLALLGVPEQHLAAAVAQHAHVHR